MKKTIFSSSVRSKALLLATALVVVPGSAFAQDATADGEETAEPEGIGQEIIVTGTSRGRVALDTPLAVTQVDDEALARFGVSSQADILNTIPTIKADAGGGEVASNVFVRGLPSGGQYQFTPLMY
ncbi:MAG: TonB-dependent receptor plug domain-containing protein, partial [Sphingorhabdus sp.]